MSILIKKVKLEEKIVDILVEGGLIKKIGSDLNETAEKIIEGKNKAVLPGLVNGHTHAAMTLLRGYADDKKLKDWLEKEIWPAEKKLTQDDIYWATKLACLEMIKSGTTCFNDMYWEPEATIKAVREMGVRAFIGLLMIDFDKRGQKDFIEEQYNRLYQNLGNRIQLTIAPHAIYTVAKENLLWAKNFAEEHNLLIHLHLSETKEEVDNCLKEHNLRPAEYLNSIGFLGPNLILAHAIWLTDEEIELLAVAGASVVYNPASNMKLASGVMPYQKLKRAGIRILLGTDGVSSNNNLDLFEEMKFGSLLQKISFFDPTILPVEESLDLATINAAQPFNLKVGQIKEGFLADLILIDLRKTEFIPGYNFKSDLVYAANGSCVDSVICDGKILMLSRFMEKELEIIEKCQEISERFKKK